jgi:addiction module RelB/DinJ family antitoxin
MTDETVLFRARVPARRLKRAQEVLDKLGLKPSDALNMLLAQIELRQALPFEVSTVPRTVLSSAEQAEQWTEALGDY